jgi:hypothetical protein
MGIKKGGERLNLLHRLLQIRQEALARNDLRKTWMAAKVRDQTIKELATRVQARNQEPFQVGQGILFQKDPPSPDKVHGIVTSVCPPDDTHFGYCTIKTVTSEGIRDYGLIYYHQIQALPPADQERVERVMRDAIQNREAQQVLARIHQEAQATTAVPPPDPEPEVEKTRRILFRHKDPDKTPDKGVSGGQIKMHFV